MNTEIQQKFQLKKSFILFMVVFTILLQLVYFFGRSLEVSLYLKALIALLPVVPFLLALISMVSMIKQDDEMFKKITADSFILTGCITLTWTLAAGLLQQLDIIPSFSVFYVYCTMLMTFSFSYLFTSKKYQ